MSAADRSKRAIRTALFGCTFAIVVGASASGCGGAADANVDPKLIQRSCRINADGQFTATVKWNNPSSDPTHGQLVIRYHRKPAAAGPTMRGDMPLPFQLPAHAKQRPQRVVSPPLARVSDAAGPVNCHVEYLEFAPEQR